MKTRLLTFIIAFIMAGSALAYGFKYGDLYYNITDETNRTVEVTCELINNDNNYSSLSETVTIPEFVFYQGKQYRVTRIGNSAFMYCSVTQITIPNSVTSIEGQAFYKCNELKEATIPNSVTSIGYSAFRDCSSLKKVTISNSVKNIEEKAFSNCSSLKEIIIPNSVTSIGESAFSSCKALTQITIPNNLTSISIGLFGGCSTLKEVTIPNSVTSIGEYAFSSCSALTQITIPNNVTSIGNGLFSNCSALKEVTIPNNVTSIGRNMFNSCRALTQITIPNSVTNIGDNAFNNCSALTQITIPDNVTNIGYNAFTNCSALTQITIPNSLTSISNGVFNGCSALKEITIPNNITSIGEYAFYRCSALTQMTVLASEPPKLSYLGININIPIYVHKQVLEKYKRNNDWKDFNLQELTYEYKNLYYNITDLTNMTAEVTYESYMDENNYSSLPAVVTIPETVNLYGDEYRITGIGENAFYGCNRLTQVTIPKSVTNIGENAFAYCNALKEINVESGNTAYCSEDGVLFNKDKTILIKYPIGKTNASYTIPNSVTSIGHSAFNGCSALQDITIPNSVTSIGEMVFAQCSALTQVNMGNNVKEIGSGAFRYCTEIKQITIPSTVISIGIEAFYRCYSLNQMTIHAIEPPTLGNDAFYLVNRDIPVYVPQKTLHVYKVTNIWNEFNLQGISTGIMTPSLPESITICGSMIQNPQALKIDIYDLQGRIIYSGNATTFTMPSGIYIIRCGEACSKVIF